ncbi:hypothetical protein Mal4_47900 [Maioricimonas rarisocia]|uniref:SLA1 homology domain-containing protein n=1 Tax=Maioricimonas rarisocia TaxID=2528026 RepID=A0A517ZD67_9PLAN|nr:hypothetical protein [Maioricimonas rarisocia]QDU40434.1 hypothetical protein Mal4_47900 [Maioricimonas rarisocia]
MAQPVIRLWPMLRVPAGMLAVLLYAGSLSAADTYVLEEPSTDTRVRLVQTEVNTQGKVKVSVGGGRSASHELDAAAAFRFLERRLPPGGRDAEALRAIRQFEQGTMQTTVAENSSGTQLPAANSLVVSSGRREGVLNYCPEAALTRDSLDLLELPGDTLALVALLPPGPVEVGGSWAVADWAAQMLATIEAVESAEMKCTLASVSGNVAKIDVAGEVVGQRLGANSTVKVTGQLTYDLQQKFIARGSLEYKIESGIGTITPGIDATVNANIERSLSPSAGRLTDAVAEAIPLEPPAGALELVFAAAPWGMSLRHDREWYVFQALLHGSNKVLILRRMERGSLIAQCNCSPVPTVKPGQQTPADQFEADIQRSLGERFGEIRARERVPTDDGRMITRVIVGGSVELKGDKGAVDIPMMWIYYLVTDPNGRQMSFVFSVEPDLHEQLGDRDVAMVKSVRFVQPQ